jgi:hypothetical protein
VYWFGLAAIVAGGALGGVWFRPLISIGLIAVALAVFGVSFAAPWGWLALFLVVFAALARTLVTWGPLAQRRTSRRT